MRRLALLALLASALACPLPSLAHGVQPDKPVRTLTIGGGVERRLALDVDELRKRPAAQIAELRLPSRSGGTSTVRGVHLRDLLDEAKIVTQDHNTVKKLAIVAAAADGYKVVFSWNELFNAKSGEQVLVLFERDGKPLADTEGPLALISGADLRTGPRHVKWLQSVDVRQVAE